MAKEPEAPAEEVAVATVESLRTTRPGTDANVWIQLMVGVVGTVIISYAVFPFKGKGAWDYLYGIINQRGPVQYLELLMSLMVTAFIYLKGRIVNRNMRVIASNPVPLDLDLADDKALQEFRDNLAQRDEFSWSILLNRLDRALALWLGSKDIGRVQTWAQAESSRDVGSSDSSYALSRVLMWAIPILGFIGTVQGLGQAVAGFGVLGGSADISAIKGAIGQVTVGLGVAFDTTLLALVLTTLLMFPLTSFQRREENLFGEIDNYMDDVLMARLPSPEQQPIVIENLEDSIEAAFRRYIPDPDRYDEVFTRSIEKAAASVEEKFNGLSKNYEVTLRDMSERLSVNLGGFGKAMEETLRGLIGDIRKQDESLVAARKSIGQEESERFRGMLDNVHSASERLLADYKKSAEALQATGRESLQQAQAASKELATRLQDVTRLAAGIQDLLKIEQAMQQSLSSISASDDFRKTLEEIRRNLGATSDLCTRLSRPRVITLKEEAG